MSAQQTPSSIIASSRVASILTESISKLHFLGAIAPDVLQHRDSLTAFVGGEISRIITEQRSLENRYEELITMRGALKGLSNKTKYKAVQTEIQDVSHSLRESTKSLCRNLKDNPNIAGNLVKIHRERTALIDILTSTIAELNAGGTITTLVARVNEDKNSQSEQKQILAKERDTARKVMQLDEDLEAERAEHASVVTEQREEMATLKEQLMNIRTRASVDVRFQRAEANAKSASILREFRQEEATVLEKIQGLREKLEVEKTVSQESTKFLVRKQEVLRGKLGEWEEKYETDLSDLTVRYNKLLSTRDANFAKLTHLRERRAGETAKEQAKEEARIAEIEAKKVAAELKVKMDNAATMIAAFGRLFLKRQKEKGAAKGGKGGKKGKKDKM